MATLPSPRTWTVGELLNASKLNVDLRDGLNFLLAPPLAIMRQTSNQSVGATTTLVYGAHDIDRDGGHSTVSNTDRYTAKTAGWYQVTGLISLSSFGSMEAIVVKTAPGPTVTNYPGFLMGNSTTGGRRIPYTAHVLLAVNDYVTTVVNTGSTTTDTFTRMEVRWVSS